MPEKATAPGGVLVIDKPEGPTSHDIVAHVRKLASVKQVGHAGTLDPFATGVLIVALGFATRLLEYTRDLPKTYLATITLGATSDTDDRTGKISASPGLPAEALAKVGEEVRATLQTFIGSIQQIPPAYSAVKVKGKKLYEYAREGRGLPAEALAKAGDRRHPVVIHSIKLLSYTYPTLKLEITCGGGVYIRALARDIGEALGTGAYVQELRRTAVGPFDLGSSITLDKLSTPRLGAPSASLGVNSFTLLPPETLINHLPKLTLDPTSVAKLQKGQAIEIAAEEMKTLSNSPLSGGEKNTSLPDKGGSGWVSPIAVFDQNNSLLGIGKFDPTTSLASPKPSVKAGLLHPQKVLA